jgi:hypothetical protein
MAIDDFAEPDREMFRPPNYPIDATAQARLCVGIEEARFEASVYGPFLLGLIYMFITAGHVFGHWPDGDNKTQGRASPRNQFLDNVQGGPGGPLSQMNGVSGDNHIKKHSGRRNGSALSRLYGGASHCFVRKRRPRQYP